MRRRRWLLVGLLATILGLVAATAVLVAARYYPAYRSALAGRADLEWARALLRERGLELTEPERLALQTRLERAEQRFEEAERTFDDPFLAFGQRLPIIGGPLSTAPAIAAIGVESARLGQDALEVTRVYQRWRDTSAGAITEQVPAVLADLDRPMAAVSERLNRIRLQREEIGTAGLAGPAGAALEELDEGLEEIAALVETYAGLRALLPEALGFHGPRTYLLLAQNNAELLPTGGLISVYGLITVEKGRIVQQRFEDAVSFGGRWMERTGAYVEPPGPLRRYLLRDMSWNLALANWSPDFPTAARQAEQFFVLGGGQPVDGVIAINIHTIEALLRVTGPITVEPYGVTVTPENAFEVIEAHTRAGLEPGRDRKAFVGDLAELLIARLMETPPERWDDLIETLDRLRRERQLLLFFDDPLLQEQVVRLGLDGGLVQAEGDYLMLVDASVQSTKLNMVLDQRVTLSVRLDALGNAEHRVDVAYQNNLPDWAEGRDPVFVRRLMLSGRYGGYLRALVPRGSVLEQVAVDGQDVGAEEIAVEGDKAVFGRFFTLPSGARTTLTFAYRTGGVVSATEDALEYRLYLQKQSGTDATPVAIRLHLPEGARLTAIELDGEPLAPSNTIETDLAQDRELVVRYRMEA